jgi:hypothetical protein
MAGLGLIPGFGGSNQGSVRSAPYTVPDLTLRWQPFYGQKTPPHSPSVVYALDLGSGSFVETGNAATFAVGFPLGSGSFTGTGNNLGIAVGFPLGSGSFAETGYSVGFALGFSLGTGSFVETGYSLGISVGFPLGSGAFAETGYSAGFALGFPLGTGSFVETGYAASFSIGEPLGFGSFTETGYPAEIAANRALGLGYGSFTLSGYSIDIATGKNFQLGAGDFALAGYSLTIVIPARRLNAGAGAFTLSGYPLGITAIGGLIGDPGLPTGSFKWPKFPEGNSTLRLSTIKTAFTASNWEAFLQLANVRCADDYGYKGLISQTLTDAASVLDPLTGRLALSFTVNDGRTFMVDLPDDMRGIYRGVLRQLIQ